MVANTHMHEDRPTSTLYCIRWLDPRLSKVLFTQQQSNSGSLLLKFQHGCEIQELFDKILQETFDRRTIFLSHRAHLIQFYNHVTIQQPLAKLPLGNLLLISLSPTMMGTQMTLQPGPNFVKLFLKHNKLRSKFFVRIK